MGLLSHFCLESRMDIWCESSHKGTENTEKISEKGRLFSVSSVSLWQIFYAYQQVPTATSMRFLSHFWLKKRLNTAVTVFLRTENTMFRIRFA
jgi:hypothetical protein